MARRGSAHCTGSDIGGMPMFNRVGGERSAAPGTLVAQDETDLFDCYGGAASCTRHGNRRDGLRRLDATTVESKAEFGTATKGTWRN
jgi:hypothetical protein